MLPETVHAGAAVMGRVGYVTVQVSCCDCVSQILLFWVSATSNSTLNPELWADVANLC